MPTLFRRARRRALDLSDNQQVVKAARIPDAKERTFVENRLRVPINRFSDDTSYLETSCKRVWATFRACHLVANVVVGTQFSVTRKGETEPVKDREVNRLLVTPNPLDSWAEMLYMWTFHVKTTGRAFWLKDEMDLKGRPKNIYPLLPQHMRIIPNAKKGIDHFVYHVNGQEFPYERDEIIYFKRPHPTNLLLGMGDIEPSQDLYNQHINRNKYEEAFMENGCQPSGVLTLKEPLEDPEEWGKLKAWWNREYSGKKNAGKTAFLSGDWNYHQLGINQKDMEALERDELSIEHIFANHGVPLSIAGVRDAANFATSRQDDLNFRRYEIMPLIDILCGKLNREGELFKNFNPAYELDYNLSGLIDIEQVMKDYKPLFEAAGMTPNDLREKAGLQRVDDPYLDQYFLPKNLVPVAMAGLADPADDKLTDIVKRSKVE